MINERLDKIEDLQQVLTPGFDRDEKSGAILANDSAALKRHKSQRELNARIRQLENICGDLKKELREVKELLSKCVGLGA